jgi:hypothetical protein
MEKSASRTGRAQARGSRVAFQSARASPDLYTLQVCSQALWRDCVQRDVNYTVGNVYETFYRKARRATLRNPFHARKSSHKEGYVHNDFEVQNYREAVIPRGPGDSIANREA